MAPQFRHDLNALDAKISGLSLVDEAAVSRGAVLILAGIGGPDAVRQILTACRQAFPRAVLISQRLDGGRYDRLVQQMARAAAMPVTLAERREDRAGPRLHLPPELGIEAAKGLRFATGGPLSTRCPPTTPPCCCSAARIRRTSTARSRMPRNGALVAGQSPDGCYDAAAPMALTARGGTPPRRTNSSSRCCSAGPPEINVDVRRPPPRYPRRPHPGRRRAPAVAQRDDRRGAVVRGSRSGRQHAGLAARPHPLARLAVAVDRVLALSGIARKPAGSAAR